LEKKLSEKVLIQGRRYSFHDQAAASLRVPEDQRESVKTHDLLYDALADRPNGRAVVAFANTTKGRIEGSYERILAGAGIIVARANLEIVLPLYGMPGADRQQVRYLHSQKHAFDQSIETIRTYYPNARLVYESDTASSASTVRELADPTHAAITPGPAGEAAGLEKLVASMQDRKRNVTSFYMLGKGDNGIVPDDATVTVATLNRVGDEHANHWLQAEVDREALSLVHQSDNATPQLIIEMNSDGDHRGVIENAQIALEGLYDVTYLGGYTPLMSQNS
jgi:prephenate dehydratase